MTPFNLEETRMMIKAVTHYRSYEYEPDLMDTQEFDLLINIQDKLEANLFVLERK